MKPISKLIENGQLAELQKHHSFPKGCTPQTCQGIPSFSISPVIKQELLDIIFHSISIYCLAVLKLMLSFPVNAFWKLVNSMLILNLYSCVVF